MSPSNRHTEIDNNAAPDPIVNNDSPHRNIQTQSRLAQFGSRISSLLPSRDNNNNNDNDNDNELNDEEYEEDLQQILDVALPQIDDDDINDNDNDNGNDLDPNQNQNQPQQSRRHARMNALRQRVQSIGQQAMHRLRV